MDVFKELVFESTEAQAVNRWLEIIQPNLTLLGGQLFPNRGGLTRIQMRVRTNHDTGEVVGIEIVIGMGSVPEETK